MIIEYLSVGKLIDILSEFQRETPIRIMTCFGISPIIKGDGVLKKSPDGKSLLIDDGQATYPEIKFEDIF